MLSSQKCISIFVFAMVTLLSCSSPSSSLGFLPRVSRTDDAIIVDYADQEIAAPHQGQNLYGGNANPADFNPYFQPQQPKFYNGWGYYYAYPSYTSSSAAGALSNWQYGVEGERQAVKQGATTTTTTTIPTTTTTPTTTTIPTTTTTPAPVIQCGRGPAIFPISQTGKSFDEPFQPSISGKLAGATDAKKDAWPFTALILQQATPICVGTLISESKVLLSAQCLEQQIPFNVDFMSISIGVQSIAPLVARMTRRISKFVFHSQYDATTFANDLAIITLDIPVSFSKNVAPVCLPPASTDPNQYVDQSAIVLGWDGSTKVQQGKVSIVSNDECKTMPTISQYVSDTTICINSDTVFTCRKDIGGPVVVMSSPGTWTLVGINSFTLPTCTSSGLKTRVSAFRSWIDQNMQN